ncbi:MAG TPA: cytochrome c [Fimbriiglobus sp.]|nr:cytochrome c [Fimbriiglobus sp.]
MPMTLDRQHAAAPPGLAASPAVPEAAAGDHPRLTRRQKAVLIGTPVALVLATWVAPVAFHRRPAAAPAPVAAARPDGAKLYAEHCARCHGERGDGVGTISSQLSVPARNFGEGKFRLATTTNGVANDEDLLRVLRRGIPGSAMPAFDRLADEELTALIGRVRELTRQGMLARACRKAEEQGGADLAEVAAAVEVMCRPGEPVAVTDSFPPPTPESIARGRLVYLNACAQCHGPEGRGDGPQVKDLKNEDGSPTRPRDLTGGLFKGGGEPERLYARIVLGMPGTPMPASTTLKPQEIGDLINFILSLSEARPVATGGANRAVNP